MPDSFEIVVGTYEQYLLGYKINNVVNEYKMEKTFATHSHLSSIRSVASSKHYLATAGADDSVFLYDLRYRVESGRLMHHNDTVNCVAFTPEASHLFTCSNDGTIAAIRCGNWQMEKQWLKPHKGLAVNTLAIHPTGKIALSSGADGILRTWNLVKGRQAYATNLVPRMKLDAKNVSVLKWSPNGEKYLLAANQRIDVYSVELAGIDSEIRFDSKIVCVEFLKDDLIAVGLENGRIKLYDLEKSVETVEAIAHDIRVKCMAFKDNLLVTASSTGEIKLWRYSKYQLDMLQKVNCGARITCLSLAIPYKNLVSNGDVHAKEEEEEEEEEEGVEEVGDAVKKTKFRLRQEVVVEQEGNWQVTPLDSPGTEVAAKKSKKKRIPEEAQFPHHADSKRIKSVSKKKKGQDDPITDGIPKKKQKLSKTKHVHVVDEGEDDDHSDGYKNRSANKKRKDGESFEEENNNAPSRKAKKSSGKISVPNSSESNEATKNHGPVPSKKRKKEAGVEGTGAILRKKKKKQ